MMSRRLRVHVPGGYYHVTLRGNHRQAIFRDPADRSALDAIVRGAAERYDAWVTAYCWMTNHIHLVVRVGEEPLGRLMQMVGSRYARYLQHGTGTTGHCFERRYHAVLVADQRQLLDVIRYVHLNPVRAGLVAEPRDYPWSSHCLYLGLRDSPWVVPDEVLALLATDASEARRAFAAYCGDAVQDPRCMQAARDLLAAAGAPSRPGCRRRDVPGRSLDQLVDEVCVRAGLPADVLAGPGRDHALSALRGEVAVRAAEEGCASLSDVARKFNRSLSSISRSAARWRRVNGAEKCKGANPVPLKV
jgi:putative transposase